MNPITDTPTCWQAPRFADLSLGDGGSPAVTGLPEKSGETQTRTGDTTIFSRVLYQLSYLAEAATRVAPAPVQPAAQACSVGSGSIGCESFAYQPSGQISKCRWAPSASPVSPTWPICWPAATGSPWPTSSDPATRCMKT